MVWGELKLAVHHRVMGEGYGVLPSLLPRGEWARDRVQSQE